MSRFVISVPRLPLYSRATFAAGGAHRSRFYVVHIIRLGEAMDLSLQGAVKDGQPFKEKRRLRYLKNHVEWYLPSISGQVTLSMQIRPISFAPLVSGSSLAEIPQVMDTCRCGNITAGFGSACDFQLELPEHRLCVFVAEATRKLGDLHDLSGVAGMSSELSAWLQNTTVSGKSVGLSIPEELSVLDFEPQDNSQAQVVESSFKLTMPADGLSRQGSQIMVSITEDATDSEVTSLPVMFSFLAPPIVLAAGAGPDSETRFLLPPFRATGDYRTEYMLCGGVADMEHIEVTVNDSRFEVVKQHVSTRPGCGNYMEHRLELRVLRKPETNCSTWCNSYPARAEDYDLAVVQSVGLCMREAMELDDGVSMDRMINQQGWVHCVCIVPAGLKRPTWRFGVIITQL